jgi:predicted alpha/beta-fold hydrolase
MKKTYERETVIAISTIALLSLALKVKAISSPKLNYRNIMPLQSVTSSDVFTQEELHTITTCYDEKEPKGQFLQDRHGFTHYKVDGSGPMVVLIHGLATSIDVYEIITTELVNSGFKVLRYDFYGHGYSKHGGDETFFDYDTDLFVDQLEDVLEHVEKEEGVQAAAICGHSTGGNVCIAANDRWSKEGSKRGIAPKMILIAPAVYAKKVRHLKCLPHYFGLQFNHNNG